MFGCLALLLAAGAVDGAIQHAPLVRVPPGKPVIIRASISGVSRTFAPQVYVRAEGRRFQGYPLEERGHDQFAARIPASAVRGALLDYFIEARLESGELVHQGSAEQPISVHIEQGAPLDPELLQEQVRIQAEQERTRAEQEKAALEKARVEAERNPPPEKPARRESKTERGAPGRLRIQSTPLGAQVLLDGTAAGTTPCAVDPVSPGSHEVLLQLEGRRDVEAHVTVPEGGDYALRIELPALTGGANAAPRLSVTSIPSGVALSIDGREVGLTPWSGEVAAGERRVSVASLGYKPAERKVRASPNREVDTQFQLERNPGPAHLRIETEPASARVLVDGQPAGQAPLALDVAAGDHEITAEADGARAVSQRLLVLPGESLSVHLALVQASKIPAPPLIAVVTQPPGATLLLDGKEQGTTPRKVTSTPGPHEVKLVLEGLAPRTVKLNVPDRHDYELRLAVTLQPGRPQEENTPVDPLAQARAWLARAGSCYRQGDYACALENYQKAYQYKPKPDLLFNIGHAQRRLKEYTKAAAAYRAFIKEAPRSPMRREAEKLAALCELLAQGHKEPPADEDTTPPSLQHEPIARALRAQPLRIAAKIVDDRSGVAGQQLCYRNFFQREYQCAPLVNENEGELYTFDIPAAAVTDGLAYYLEAYDNAGNGPSRSGTPEGPHTVGIADELSDLPGPAAAAKAADDARAQVASREKDEASVKINAAPQEAVSTRTTLFARTRMVTWVMAGAGAAVLGTGLVFGHLASVHSENAPGSPSNLALQDLAQRQATASTALVSIGGTLLVAALANEVIDLMTPVAEQSPR